MHKTADIVIIGGGVIGASSAWQLARRGKKVILVERSDHAAGASGSCDQAIIMQSKNPGVHLKLALASVDMFEAMPAEFKKETEFVRHGGMILIENQDELEVMQKFVKRQQETGLKVELLDAKAMHARQRGLAAHLVGAAYSPQDAAANPYKLNLALAALAREAGAEILLHTTATGFRREGDRVAGVETSSGTIGAETVILAAGAWSPLLAGQLGLDIPIKPRRGQIVITEPVAPLINSVVLSAFYIAVKYNPALADKPENKGAQGLSLDQSRKGNILIGATREFVGYDTRTTREGVRDILKNATRMAPALKDIGVIRVMAGLRPYTPDGLPLLGWAPSAPGLFLACGHEGDGIALSLVTGRLVAEQLCDGTTFMDIEALRPGRFTVAC